MFTIDTQVLIIQLFNQELKRAKHPVTLHYHKELEDAKQDFIEHCSKLPPKTAVKQ